MVSCGGRGPEVNDIGGKASGGEEEKDGRGNGCQEFFHGAFLLRVQRFSRLYCETYDKVQSSKVSFHISNFRLFLTPWMNTPGTISRSYWAS